MSSIRTANDSPLRGTARKAVDIFAERFGAPPVWLAAAPGRVNLIGEHTDYNDGFVLPLAIDRHVVIAAAPALPGDDRMRMFSDALNSSVVFGTGDALTAAASVRSQTGVAQPPWANYLRGVLSGFVERGASLSPLNLVIVSDLPLGGGLASSASLEVAMATLLERTTGTPLSPVEKARLCRKAEHEFAGVPCGIMDQTAAVSGDERGALLIDCRTEQFRVIPFADPDVAILICNSNIKHSLAAGSYRNRRAECSAAACELGVSALRDATPQMVATAALSDEILRRRARHVTTENARTLAASELLRAREFAEVGRLMYESHESLRADFEVSCRELDVLVASARDMGEKGGVYGARMTGGGFGGCTVNLVRSDSAVALASSIASEYHRKTGLHATTFVARPARGARLVDPAGLTG